MAKHPTMKKGDSKALAVHHPNSRKAKALAKKILRHSKREKTKLENALKKSSLVGDKLLWFQERLPPSGECTPEMLSQLIEKYLGRFDEELEQIMIKHSIGQRKNRQHASREDVILMTKEREMLEYETCGIEMVDILNPKQLKQLKEWDGNLNVQFKMRRFSKSFLTNKTEKKVKTNVNELKALETVSNTNNEVTQIMDT